MNHHLVHKEIMLSLDRNSQILRYNKYFLIFQIFIMTASIINIFYDFSFIDIAVMYITTINIIIFFQFRRYFKSVSRIIDRTHRLFPYQTKDIDEITRIICKLKEKRELGILSIIFKLV